LKREANRLSVKGLDFFDGTPIIDIKGYGPQYRSDQYRLPDWFNRIAGDKGNI
jgi:tRNA (Thr-GGU) A37 N-methylase